MTDNQKLVSWCCVGLIAAVLVANSIPDRGIAEGHRGTYLGAPAKQRDIAQERVKDLASRTEKLNY